MSKKKIEDNLLGDDQCNVDILSFGLMASHNMAENTIRQESGGRRQQYLPASSCTQDRNWRTQ